MKTHWGIIASVILKFNPWETVIPHGAHCLRFVVSSSPKTKTSIVSTMLSDGQVNRCALNGINGSNQIKGHASLLWKAGRARYSSSGDCFARPKSLIPFIPSINFHQSHCDEVRLFVEKRKANLLSICIAPSAPLKPVKRQFQSAGKASETD